MENRPIFILSILRDYDGYEQETYFTTFDFKEAIRRYKFLINYVKEEWFLNHDVPEEDMNINIRIPNKKDIHPGFVNYSNMDDNCECYISVIFECFDRNKFKRPGLEEQYHRYMGR